MHPRNSKIFLRTIYIYVYLNGFVRSVRCSEYTCTGNDCWICKAYERTVLLHGDLSCGYESLRLRALQFRAGTFRSARLLFLQQTLSNTYIIRFNSSLHTHSLTHTHTHTHILEPIGVDDTLRKNVQVSFLRKIEIGRGECDDG